MQQVSGESEDNYKRRKELYERTEAELLSIGGYPNGEHLSAGGIILFLLIVLVFYLLL